MSEKIIHILLAEDERTLAMIIKDTLDGQGFSVTVASDGEVSSVPLRLLLHTFRRAF